MTNDPTIEVDASGKDKITVEDSGYAIPKVRQHHVVNNTSNPMFAQRIV